MILIGILSLSYILIFLLTPKDVIDYTIVDTEYWRETNNRLLLKTAYDYNSKTDIEKFPKNIGDWRSFDYRYPDYVYTKLDAEIMLSRAYTKDGKNIVWMDIINSKTGASFHKQNICVEGAGWNIDNESIAEFDVAESPNPFTKLYANRLDVSKGDKKQVIIYWFMFKKFTSDNFITMIRLSSPVNSDINTTFDLTKKFVEEQLFNDMYRETKEETTVVEYLIRKDGYNGKITIMIGVLIPLSIIFVGIRRRTD